MDKSKHVITVPYDDYIVMRETQEKYETMMENIKEHQKIMSTHLKEKVRFTIDETRFPKGIKSIHEFHGLVIHFQY